MYAIAFDLKVAELQKHYPTAYNNAYKEIEGFLSQRGFTRQQGSVYFGDDTVNAVNCVMTVNAMSNHFPWFKLSVTDIRMLRIEENNDLNPAL